ncbi:hypothetical protein Taro_009375, partial [Colocasia esculenta]|nr:hypothetical protein [Colocasia esculenta]
GHVLIRAVRRSPRYDPRDRTSSSSAVAHPRAGHLSFHTEQPRTLPISAFHHHAGHLLEVAEQLSVSSRWLQPPQATRPIIKRRVNCLASQRTPECVTPPVMRTHLGAFSGTIYQHYARLPPHLRL